MQIQFIVFTIAVEAILTSVYGQTTNEAVTTMESTTETASTVETSSSRTTEDNVFVPLGPSGGILEIQSSDDDTPSRTVDVELPLGVATTMDTITETSTPTETASNLINKVINVQGPVERNGSVWKYMNEYEVTDSDEFMKLNNAVCSHIETVLRNYSLTYTCTVLGMEPEENIVTTTLNITITESELQALKTKAEDLKHAILQLFYQQVVGIAGIIYIVGLVVNGTNITSLQPANTVNSFNVLICSTTLMLAANN